MAAELEGSLRNLVVSKTLKWIFVGGKGGVGKTTTSCSLAIQLAATRQNVLLVSTDPAHNLSDAFSQTFTGEPTRVNGFDNLDAMEVEPPAASTGANMLDVDLPQSTNVADMLANPDIASSLMGDLGTAIPGIDEAMAFGTLMKSVRDMAYDVVVFDTAPTGHTMRLLGFPQLLEKGLSLFRTLLTRFGPMASGLASTMGIPGLDLNELTSKLEGLEDVTKEVSQTFADEKKCTFVCVCIPEFLSVYETERLIQDVAKFDIQVTNIVVNQIIRAKDLADAKKSEELYKARMEMQTKYMRQIAELYGEDFHITAMPLLSGEVRGKDALSQYSKLMMVEKKEFVQDLPGMNDIGEYEGSLRNITDDSNLRWVFVGGKGGVGKTTTSSSLGVALEGAGKKVMLVSTDPAHNLSDAFSQKIASGTTPTKLQGYNQLYALEIDATEEAERFMSKIVESTQTTGQNGDMNSLIPIDSLRQLLATVPGVDEAVAFTQIMRLARTMEFDIVVFDTAPTGHTLRLLDFPKVADKALGKFEELRQSFGPMLTMFTGSNPEMVAKIREADEQLQTTKQGLQEVISVLNDQERTTFICVAIAEFLSVYETERLVQSLCEMNVNVRNILVNQLMKPSEQDITGILKTRSVMQKKYLLQIDDLYPRDEFHVTYMPLLPLEVRGVEALRKYGKLGVEGDTIV